MRSVPDMFSVWANSDAMTKEVLHISCHIFGGTVSDKQSLRVPHYATAVETSQGNKCRTSNKYNQSV
eukprot:2992565-Amphidinium_carterae.1